MSLFPLLYHAHHTRHLEDLPFWLDLASSQAGSILELGCGTGRILIPMARAGYKVYGLDRDPAMLAVLQNQIRTDISQKVHIFQADLAAFRLAKSFELILLPCNTLSTLSPDIREAMLHCVRQHLSPGGVFAASLPNPQLLKRMESEVEEEVEETFAHPVDQQPVQVSSAWQRTREVFRLFWHYDHLHKDGVTDRITAIVEHRLDELPAYQAAFQKAGFRIEATYGDFDRSPYCRRSPNLILLSRVDRSGLPQQD